MEKNINIRTSQHKLDGDMYTPTQVYVKLRDAYPRSLLFESSDYNTSTNSFSFICLNPIIDFTANAGTVETKVRGGEMARDVVSNQNVLDSFSTLKERLSVTGEILEKVNGFFGYTNYSAVQYFDSLRLKNQTCEHSIPDICLSYFQHIIVFNHFNSQMILVENLLDGMTTLVPEILNKIKGRVAPTLPFYRIGEVRSNLTDDEFINNVKKGIAHCMRGDVFQIVLSRQFIQAYKGDEFALYRKLRTVNPSPYLFFFDYGNYQLLGSSPEAQLIVQDGEAEIHPIAGTYKRTGDDAADHAAAKALAADPKENQEHTMLVDLARNDLSRAGEQVRVDKLKEIQFFSHVIHLVSRVVAKVKPKDSLELFAKTFPAGTLSGAPKYRAMELIDEIENQSREIYGGAIGFFGLNGNINTAIVIRTFLCKNKKVYAQAGAGVVSKSNPKREMQEVNNKLNALMSALEKVEE